MFRAFADLVVHGGLGLDPGSRLGAAVHFFVMDVAKILVLLAGVIYLLGLVRALLTPERVRAFMLRRSRLGSRIAAVCLGAVTPFCSCSSVPLFIGFVEAGIPLGVTLSFLIASPMINQVAVVVLTGVIGWRLAAAYVLTGMTVALAGGIALERLRPERWVEQYVWKLHAGRAEEVRPDTSLAARHRYAWGQVKEIVGRVWKLVLIGIAIGALVHGYVPSELIARAGGGRGPLSVAAAVVVGVPLYSDAVGMIPIAQVLLSKGIPVGTVLAFTMAVTALSVPEMLILRKVARWPLLGAFAAYLALAFVVVGVVFNALGSPA